MVALERSYHLLVHNPLVQYIGVKENWWLWLRPGVLNPLESNRTEWYIWSTCVFAISPAYTYQLTFKIRVITLGSRSGCLVHSRWLQWSWLCCSVYVVQPQRRSNNPFLPPNFLYFWFEKKHLTGPIVSIRISMQSGSMSSQLNLCWRGKLRQFGGAFACSPDGVLFCALNPSTFKAVGCNQGVGWRVGFANYLSHGNCYVEGTVMLNTK